MPSATYELIREAILNERQITCHYENCYRELCPHTIGHSDGEEKLLAWQFGGQTRSVLPRGGMWRCLHLSRVSDVTARDGPWHTGASHRTTQTCVTRIDLDINVHVRARPR